MEKPHRERVGGDRQVRAAERGGEGVRVERARGAAGAGGVLRVDLAHQGLALVAVADEQAQPRREAAGLLGPVLDEGGGADDERRHPARSLVEALQRDPGERLDGLAEAHLVGEDASGAAALEGAQPGDAGALVGAQRRAQGLGDGGGVVRGGRAGRVERADALGPRLGRGIEVDEGGGEAREAADEERRERGGDAERAAERGLARAAFAQQVGELVERGGVEEQAARAVHDPRAPVAARRADVGRRDVAGAARGLEGVVHVERAGGVRGLADADDRRDALEVRGDVGEVALGDEAPAREGGERGGGRGEQLQRGVGAAQRREGVAAERRGAFARGAGAGEAVGGEDRERGALGIDVADEVVVGVGRVGEGEVLGGRVGRDGRRRAAGLGGGIDRVEPQLDRGVLPERVGAQREERAAVVRGGGAQREGGLGGRPGEGVRVEPLVEAHVELPAQARQLVQQEAARAEARDADRVEVDALVDRRDDRREGEEAAAVERPGVLAHREERRVRLRLAARGGVHLRHQQDLALLVVERDEQVRVERLRARADRDRARLRHQERPVQRREAVEDPEQVGRSEHGRAREVARGDVLQDVEQVLVVLLQAQRAARAHQLLHRQQLRALAGGLDEDRRRDAGPLALAGEAEAGDPVARQLDEEARRESGLVRLDAEAARDVLGDEAVVRRLLAAGLGLRRGEGAAGERDRDGEHVEADRAGLGGGGAGAARAHAPAPGGPVADEREGGGDGGRADDDLAGRGAGGGVVAGAGDETLFGGAERGVERRGRAPGADVVQRGGECGIHAGRDAARGIGAAAPAAPCAANGAHSSMSAPADASELRKIDGLSSPMAACRKGERPVSRSPRGAARRSFP